MTRSAALIAAFLAHAVLASACTAPAAPRTSAATPTGQGSATASSRPEASPGAAAAETESSDPAPPRFGGRIRPLPTALRREMRGTTWERGCPVPLSDLRLLTFGYWGFDGEVDRGPMVVHQEVAEDVLWVFGRLFRARFPIKRVALAREFVPEEWEPVTFSRRSVTAAFNCRPVVTPLGPGSSFSQHAHGLAIDINPVQNPYVTADGFVRNRASRRYLDRSKGLQGMIRDGDVVVRSFAAIGWEWGGHWSGGKDYMHFSRAGA